MESRIQGIFDPNAKNDFASSIKKDDADRKIAGLASLRAKIAAGQQLLTAADELVVRAKEAAQAERQKNMSQDSTELYCSLEGLWGCLEEMIDLFNLGQALCVRIAGDVPISAVDKFAKQVVEADQKDIVQ